MNAKMYELKTIQTNFPRVKIVTNEDAAKFIRELYNDDIEIFESFFILMLNISNQTIGYAKISQGGITGTVVDVRIVAKYAVESLAISVVLAHNHPSGKLQASENDILITEKIKKCLMLLDIMVMDHIILTKNGYLSMVAENLI
ncbi:JAB domain-containing protein [Flavobacterium filum]|uniref:JAB domain-containing protein n=1 Tax=Flavobacterium filum TaxID=370974 RepID=UPI00042481B0|nr:JAB domain-containing protein [Flavobacterium filum]